MAVYNIEYNPKVSVFFNSDGNLIIGDNNDWGGYNPPKSSVSSASFAILNQVTGNGYLISGVDYDLLANNFFSLGQISIDASIYNEIFNIYDLTTETNDSPTFESGIYNISFIMSGSYTVGVDTVNWITSGYNSVMYKTGVINTSSNCIEKILRNVSFAKKCSPNKKFDTLLRYINMLYEYNEYITLDGLTIRDSASRQAKTSDIFDEIKGLCNGKNNCKC